MSGTDFDAISKANAEYQKVSERLTQCYERWEELAQYAD